MKLELTSEQLKTVEIALAELSNSDIWTLTQNEADIDRIADRAVYILNIIETYNKNNPS
jgi:hypothetical protein